MCDDDSLKRADAKRFSALTLSFALSDEWFSLKVELNESPKRRMSTWSLSSGGPNEARMTLAAFSAENSRDNPQRSPNHLPWPHT